MFQKKNIEQYVNTKVVKPVEQAFAECKNFFKHSGVEKILLDLPKITLANGLNEHVYKFIRITNKPPKGQLKLDEHAAAKCLMLEKILSEGYNVFETGSTTIIANNHTGKFMVLSDF